MKTWRDLGPLISPSPALGWDLNHWLPGSQPLASVWIISPVFLGLHLADGRWWDFSVSITVRANSYSKSLSLSLNISLSIYLSIYIYTYTCTYTYTYTYIYNYISISLSISYWFYFSGEPSLTQLPLGLPLWRATWSSFSKLNIQ